MRNLPPYAIAARAVLAVGFLCLAIGMIGPFRGVERVLVPWDKAAHFLAFYSLTTLLFLGFPNRRRLDLAALAMFAGCALEVGQQIAGRDSELADLWGNAAGVCAVLLPLYVERLVRPVRVERRRRLLAETPATSEALGNA